MKLKALTLSIVLTAPCYAQAREFNPDLAHTIQQLDTDGDYFSIKKLDDDFAPAIKIMDHLMAFTAKGGPSPTKFVDSVFKSSGLRGISTIGQSAQKTNIGWINKTYIQHDFTGLPGMISNYQQQLTISEIAPLDSAVAIELNLSLKEFLPFTYATFHNPVFSKETTASLLAMFDNSLYKGMTIKTLLEQSKINLCLFGRYSKTENYGQQSFFFPALEGAIKINNLPKELTNQLSSDGISGFNLVEIDGRKAYQEATPSETILSSKPQQLIIEISKNSLTVFSNQKYFQHFHTAKEKLSSSTNFTKAKQRFPENLSLAVYVAPEATSTFTAHFAKAVNMLPDTKALQQLRTSVAETGKELESLAKRSNYYSLTLSSDKKGSLLTEISPLSNKHISLWTSSLIGATSVFHNQTKKAILKHKK